MKLTLARVIILLIYSAALQWMDAPGWMAFLGASIMAMLWLPSRPVE